MFDFFIKKRQVSLRVNVPPSLKLGRVNSLSFTVCRLLSSVCRLPAAKCQLLLFSLALLSVSACNVTKHLDEAKGERLLVKNTIEIKAEKKLNFDTRTRLQYEFATYYKQPASKKNFGLFYTRVWLYNKLKDKKSRLARLLMKKNATPPAIYDPLLTSRTQVNLENQLRFRGYLDATATYKVDSIGKKKIAVQYMLNLGPLYTIDTVWFESRDSLVLQILYMTASESRLKRGDPLDGQVFAAEKLRITGELKNRGYAFFTPNYVEFTGDSTGRRSNVTVEVLTPSDTLMHKVYTIGRIAVFSSLVPDLSSIRRDTIIDGVYFASSEPKFHIKPERLYKAIAIQPSWPYRQVDFDKTTRNLNALGVFRFVTVKSYQDSLQADKINVAISYTPSKRLAMENGVDINSITNSSALSRNLLGISTSSSFRNRNLFRGAEHLRTNLQYTIELDVATRARLIFSQEFKFQNELVLPRFFDYFGFWRAMHTIRFGEKHIVAKSLYDRMRADAQARITLNYNYLDITSFYVYNLFNASFGYELRSDGEHQYTFDHIGIDVLRPKFDPGFGANASEFLRRSFGNQLFSGFILRSFSYSYISKANHYGERWQFRLNSELSGLEELALNRLWAIPFGEQTWTISDLNFAKFMRLDLDAVYTREFRKDLLGALRIGTGVVTPYGDTKTTPYVKQFFVGGPSSIRAWRIRELGPGRYKDPAPVANQPFFQAGDFRFEFNAELRFPFFWWLKGAIFIDGGNIWTLRQEADRPGAELRWDSYKNFALGSGFGIRADFDYFVLRFDTGLKLRRPYADEKAGYWLVDRWKQAGVRPWNFNLAVGYPF